MRSDEFGLVRRHVTIRAASRSPLSLGQKGRDITWCGCAHNLSRLAATWPSAYSTLTRLHTHTKPRPRSPLNNTHTRAACCAPRGRAAA
eukprot:3119714-Prymnesium_polylepis.1